MREIRSNILEKERKRKRERERMVNGLLVCEFCCFQNDKKRMRKDRKLRGKKREKMQLYAIRE